MYSRLLLLSMGLLVASCGGDSSPTPSPTPVPSLATLFLVPDTTTPTANTFWLEQAPESVSGQIAVRVNATFTRTFSKFRGAIIFDDAVLKTLNFSEGSFMRQGGAVTDTDVRGAGTNRIDIFIDRPDSLPGATGTGTVLTIRLTATARGRTSPLQWDDAHAYTSNYSETLTRTYGGVVHVQ